MTDLKHHIYIFIIGAVGYCILELLWRGHTHPSMAIVGGVCHVLIHIINRVFLHRSYFFRALLCAGAISTVEFLSGIILNLVLNLGVWDYSRQPLNILGQICPLYSVLWFFLSLGIIYFSKNIHFM